MYTASMFKKLITGVVLAACVAPAFSAVEWMTDIEAAKTKAAAENKALLLDFTGSDWCGWCIRIRKEVFDKPRFEEYIRDKFVPVEIDIPNNPILVTDAQGMVAGGFVGGIIDPVKVESILNAGLENARKLEAAQKLSGVEKAKVLAEVYKLLPEGVQASAQPILNEILALDPEDTVGLARLAKVRAQKEEFRKGLSTIADEAALKKYLEDSLAVAYPENRSMLLNVKGSLMMNTAETEADVVAAREVLLEAAGDDAARRAQVEKALSDPAAVLKQIKAYRSRSAR